MHDGDNFFPKNASLDLLPLITTDGLELFFLIAKLLVLLATCLFYCRFHSQVFQASTSICLK